VTHHLLSLVAHKELPRDKVELPKRQSPRGYTEPVYEFRYIPEIF
jgi:hypothetical protein